MIGVESLNPSPRVWDLSLLRLCQWTAPFRDALKATWRWSRSVRIAMRARSERRSLRVTESVSLGDKRAVYLIEVEGQRLLLGASAAGVTLLSQLPPAREPWQHAVKGLVFADVIESCETGKSVKRKSRARSSAGESA